MKEIERRKERLYEIFSKITDYMNTSKKINPKTSYYTYT